MRSTVLRASLGFVLVAAAAATAQEGESPGTYTGVVKGTDVHVRARPGLTGYPCAKVSYPTQVTVVESKGGWFKIMPVGDTFSVVEKKMVRPDAAGKTITVIEDNVWIRAGGNLRSQDFWAIQRRVKRGTQLEVIGETKNFYKIKPPQGAFFWISARYVARAGARELQGRGPIRTTTRRAPGDQGIETVRSPHTRKEIKDAMAKFLAVDGLLAAEFRKPAKDRDFAPLIRKYESLRALEGGYLARYIDARLEYIKAAKERAKDVGAVDNLIEDTLAKQRQFEDRRDRIVEPKPIMSKPKRAFEATGVLIHSDLFPGAGPLPKRYALRGKLTQKIIGYVECTSGAVDLSRYVDKEVGVTGTKRFDSELGMIIDAESVSILGDAAGILLPPAPTITEERPTLAPKTPGPAPTRVTPKPKPKQELRPLPPMIEALPEPKKEPKPESSAPPKLAPMAEPRPKLSPPRRPAPEPKPRSAPPAPLPRPRPRPRPKPAPPVSPLPRTKTGPTIDGVPLIVPRAKAPKRPVAPTTRPAPRPRPKPKPETRPKTRPASAPLRPLPRTGLPLIDSGPSDSSEIVEEEYE